jgi:hypothetical protein
VSTRPNITRADRDLLADVGLTELDDRTGTGGDALHDDEPVAG